MNLHNNLIFMGNFCQNNELKTRTICATYSHRSLPRFLLTCPLRPSGLAIKNVEEYHLGK